MRGEPKSRRYSSGRCPSGRYPSSPLLGPEALERS
jgi:hypothetical protein